MFLFAILLPLSACSNKSLTPDIELTSEEVVAETKIYINTKFKNTTIYTDISLPQKYTVADKYTSYINWSSSNNSVINSTSGKVTRTLNDQTCSLTARITYKESFDSLSIYFDIPANIYEDSTKTFPKKDSIEFKVSYMSMDDTLKIKLYVANNNKSEVVYGINSVTLSIHNNSGYLIKNMKYTNSKKHQFTLSPGYCVEIELPEIALSNTYTKYLTNSKYYVSASSISYYTANGSICYIWD